MDEAHGQFDDSPTSRTSRRTALLGALGAGLTASGFAFLRFRSALTSDASPPTAPIGPEVAIPPEPAIPQRPLPEFTRLPRMDDRGTPVERALPAGADLYLLSWVSDGLAAMPDDPALQDLYESLSPRWISIVEQSRMWQPEVVTAAIVWLTPDEVTELSDLPELSSIEPVTAGTIETLKNELGLGLGPGREPHVVVSVSDPDKNATRWQLKFAGQSQVRVLVVAEPDFHSMTMGMVPYGEQVVIEVSDESLPGILREVARNAQVLSFNKGGVRTYLHCPPCGQG